MLLGLQISAGLGLLAFLISSYLIYRHLSNFNNPYFQSKIISSLLTSDSIHATFLLVVPQISQYLVLLRDAYEAVLLFVFFYLICAYLAYDPEQNLLDSKKLYNTMIQHEKQVAHFFPVNFCQKPYQLTSWEKAKFFTYRCKKWILQFLFIKPPGTLLLILISPWHATLWAQWLNWTVGWIICFSITWSLYYLVFFYHALQHPLAPHSPLLKFLTIKVTLFFTFWQRVVIGWFEQPVLQCFDHTVPGFNQQQLITRFQNLLICLQMLVMAIVCCYAYTVDIYIVRNSKLHGSLKDVVQDLTRTIQEDFRLIKPKKPGFSATANATQLQELRASLLDRKSIKFSLESGGNIKQRIDMHFFD